MKKHATTDIERIRKRILITARKYGTISAQELVKEVDPERGHTVTRVADNLAKYVPEYLSKEMVEDNTRIYTYVHPEKSPSEVASAYRGTMRGLKKAKRPKKVGKDKRPTPQVVNVKQEEQLKRAAREAGDKALLERVSGQMGTGTVAAGGRRLKVRRIVGTTLALLLLLAGALATYVWLRPAAVTTDPTMPTGSTNETETQMGTIGRETVEPDTKNGSLRQANDVVKPEVARTQNTFQAPEWSGPATFAGEIARGLKIEMKLFREGSKLSGSYYYERIGKDLQLRGTIEETGSLVLEEFVRGQKTGVFVGKFVSDGRIEGGWSKPEGVRSRDFFLVSKTSREHGG
jgi:hypothetical protein